MLDQDKDRGNDTDIRGDPSLSRGITDQHIDEDSNSLENQTARRSPETEMDSNSTHLHDQSPVESASTSGPSVDAINDDMQSDRRQQILRGLNTDPKFTDEWFRLKEDETEVQIIMQKQGQKSPETTHENIYTMEPTPDRADCLLPFPDVQHRGNVSLIKEGANGDAFAKKTMANPCNTIASVQQNEAAKPKFKRFNLEQIPPDPSPVPVIDSKGIAPGHRNEATKTKFKRFNRVNKNNGSIFDCFRIRLNLKIVSPFEPMKVKVGSSIEELKISLILWFEYSLEYFVFLT
jgi:hypothetical protein